MAGVTIQTRGADKLARLGQAIKDAGDKELKRELAAAARRSTKPLTLAARAGASRLPQRGGLAARVASAKFSTRTRTVGKGAGVRIVGRHAYNLRRMDRGVVRHPVYADGSKPRADWAWVSQPIEAGWFTEAEEAAVPAVRVELVRAVENLIRRLEARA